LTAAVPAFLEAADPRVAELISAEFARQHDTLCLIPSENHVSHAVLAASGSVLTNKYSEGYPAKRYYQGNVVVDDLEQLAARRARELSALSTPTCSRFLALRRTWRRTQPSSRRATP
jgi:glycine hydroxymethyltransferase